MLSDTDGQPQDDAAAPEILIIKDIILRDIRRVHEARMDAIQQQLDALAKDCEAQFAAVRQQIDSLAATSEGSQRAALAEVGEAVSEIAKRFRFAQGAAKDVG
jgi:hypothetical protein